MNFVSPVTNGMGPEVSVSCFPEEETVNVAKDYLCIVDRVNCGLQTIKSELVSWLKKLQLYL